MVFFQCSPLVATFILALLSPAFSAPVNSNAMLKPRDNSITPGPGPAGITCYSEHSQAIHGALPSGSGLSWFVTIPASSLPPGLPLAKKDQGTGSALHAALRHKCGLGITYEKYNNVNGGLAAQFTTPVTCADGSVHDAIDNAFHTAGGENPDAFCQNPPPSGGANPAFIAIAVLAGLAGGAEATVR